MSDFSAILQAALAPQYTLERELTGGGMSRVFVATDTALGRKVVVKVLPPELAAGVNHERFRREIQVAAQLQHPHIVPLLSAGEKGTLIWYTMPFIAGHSLREALARGERFGVKDVVRIMRDVAEALDYAHGLGVIHRDIKPGNVLLLGSHALVTDFGVAKAISAAMPSSGFTSAGMAIGTPAYMAPEQIAADPAADHRMDLYALGLLGYEMLTGQVPFKEDSPQKTMAAQLTRDPDPVEDSRGDVPPALSALVRRLLAKLPDDRPQRASEVVSQLDDIALSSGATLAPLRPLRRPSVLRAAALVAGGVAIVAAAWVLGERAGNVEGTAFVRDSLAAADSMAAIASAAAMLTSEDSMAIAKAVSERLATRPQRPVRVASTRADARADSAALLRVADSIRQEIQRAVLDSLVRQVGGLGPAMRVGLDAARLAAESRALAAAAAEGATVVSGTATPPAPTPPGAPGPVEPAAPTRQGARVVTLSQREAEARYAEAVKAGPRRVVVALPRPSRRPELDLVARVIADSLRVHIANHDRFVLVPADSVAAAMQRSRTVNGIQQALDADVIVSISLVPTRDSVVRMISLRDLAGRSGFNYRVVATSAPLAEPTAGVADMMPKTMSELVEMERAGYFFRTVTPPTQYRERERPSPGTTPRPTPPVP